MLLQAYAEAEPSITNPPITMNDAKVFTMGMMSVNTFISSTEYHHELHELIIFFIDS